MHKSKKFSDDTKNFIAQGFVEFDGLEGHGKASELYSKMYAGRPFDGRLFLSESEWEQSGKSHKGTNPHPGMNILDSLQDDVAFVEKNPELNKLLQELLGKDFRWLFKKVVCRLPRDILPDWVKELIGKSPANTLNAFMHPQYRDISYYLENDLHQDIQDYPRLPKEKQEHRILSLYVHLDTITAKDAPLYLMPGTHTLGATAYQHNIHKMAGDEWQYSDDHQHSMMSRLHPVTGPAGHIAMWHSCLIHGARPVQTGKPRLVLRYTLAQSLSDNDCGLEEINSKIQGDLFPRQDDSAGAHADKNGKWHLKETDFTRLVS